MLKFFHKNLEIFLFSTQNHSNNLITRIIKINFYLCKYYQLEDYPIYSHYNIYEIFF